MKQKTNYEGIDVFRMIASFLIVAIHTAPLASYNETADFLITYCVGRIAVPFFLMVTGYFVLAPYQRAYSMRKKAAVSENQEIWKTNLQVKEQAKVIKFLKKMVILYTISTILYIPIKIYSGQWNWNIGTWLKDIFFDGTFYHLWYLPAVILGGLLILLLIRVCSPLAISGLVLLLYLVGVLGDSYYELVSQIPFLEKMYGGMFVVSSYTRNGVFYAPVFLWLGVIIANARIKLELRTGIIGFLISLVMMMGEGYATYVFEWQKHNSMYFLLLPCMFFLFEILLQISAGKNSLKNRQMREGMGDSEGQPRESQSMPDRIGNLGKENLESQPMSDRIGNLQSRQMTGGMEEQESKIVKSLTNKGSSLKILRNLSMCIYIIHPACIVLVRGIAKVLKLTEILVDHSLVHYLAVCAVSLGISFVAAKAMEVIALKK